MKNLLERIKFIRNSKLQIGVSKKEFHDKFSTIVDEGEISIFFEAFEIFSSSKNKYIGQVKYGDFKIKKRRRFFDFNIFKSVAKGTFSEEEDSLIVNFETNAFRGHFVMMWIIPIVFSAFLIFLISVGQVEGEVYKAEMLTMLSLNLLFVISFLVGMGRYSSKCFKEEIENQIFKISNSINK